MDSEIREKFNLYGYGEGESKPGCGVHLTRNVEAFTFLGAHRCGVEPEFQGPLQLSLSALP